MPRLWSLFVAASFCAVACTGPPQATTTTTPRPTSPATATPAPSLHTTSTTTTIPSPDPELPNPVETAQQGWGEIVGFVSSDLPEVDLDAVDFRLRSFIGAAIDGISYTRLEPEGGGAPVIGLSISPATFLQGDPHLAPGLAGAIAGPFGEIEEVQIDDTTWYRVFLGDSWWNFWASNTHLYVTVGAETPAEDAMAATVQGAPLAYLWQAGDCLWFGTGRETSMPYAPYGQSRLVPCAGPHTHEVIFSSATEYGPEDEYPGDAFSTEVERSCGSAYQAYVGVHWADSKISAIRYLPDAAEWSEGDRYTACVVELSDQFGNATRITDTLEGLGTAALIQRSTGDCYLDALNADPVDCRLTHTEQFIGFFEAPEPAGSPYPGALELFESQLPACEAMVAEFAAVLEKDGARLSAHLIPPSVIEWEDDLRTNRCFANALDSDGRRIEITGSLDGAWNIVRFSEDDITAATASSALRPPTGTYRASASLVLSQP